LAEKLRGLKVRKGELQAAVDDEEQVQAPAPAELAQLRALIGNVMKLGPAAQRKARLQELVVEVRVQSRDAILPVFRLPSAGVRPLPKERGCRLPERVKGPTSQTGTPKQYLELP
jgi:hypothetical protein